MELSFPGEDYLVALAVVVFLAFLTTNSSASGDLESSGPGSL